jgi:hypothetical protein
MTGQNRDRSPTLTPILTQTIGAAFEAAPFCISAAESG